MGKIRLEYLYNHVFPSIALPRLVMCSAGELTPDEIESIKTIIQTPQQFNIPEWFLNRNKDMRTGRTLHLVSNQIAQKLREDIERMKKVRWVPHL